MKIIVLGAGRTGSSVARNLASENNDVVVVDVNPHLLQELQDRVDISTVCGMGVHPEVLERAGAAKADLLIAAMPRDEDNMLVCQVAWSLYKLPVKIARVRDTDYLKHEEQLFSPKDICIDSVICPESLVTRHIQRMIEHPGSKLVRDFSGGKVRLVEAEVQENARAVGMSIHELHLLYPMVRFVALFRDLRLMLPTTETVLRAGDKMLYVTARDLVMPMMAELHESEPPYRRLIVAGGGHIGKRVALAVQDHCKIKIIEKDEERSATIAPLLRKTIVLCGDASDRELLIDEGIAGTDLFCAVTSEDEANILSCLLAKRLGVRQAMCLVNKTAYAELVRNSAIDIVFSPDRITAASILRYARRGEVVQVFPIHRGGAEVMEAAVQPGAPIIGKRVDQINLPDGVMLGAITRGDLVLEVHHDTVFEEGDYVVMFLLNKALLPAVGKYFQA